MPTMKNKKTQVMDANEHFSDAIFHLQCLHEKLDELEGVPNPFINDPRIRQGLRFLLKKLKPWNKFVDIIYKQDEEFANEMSKANEYLRDLILNRPNTERIYISKLVKLFNDGEIPLEHDELSGDKIPLEKEKLIRIKRNNI